MQLMNIYCFLRVMPSAYKEVYPRLSTISSDDLLQKFQWLLPTAAGDTLLSITCKIMLLETRTRYLTQHTHTHTISCSSSFMPLPHFSFLSLIPTIYFFNFVFPQFPSPRSVGLIIILLIHVYCWGTR